MSHPTLRHAEPFLHRRRSPGPSLVLLALLLLLATPAAAGETVKIFCWSVTPQSQAVIQGLTRVLARPLPVVSADGDYALVHKLTKQLAQEPLKVLVVLGTPALRAVAPRLKRTLIVFAMVVDPFQTDAAYDKTRPEDHQENIIGLASPPPLEEALRQTRTLFPHRRHWGMLYNPGEGASLELAQIFAALAKEAGLTLTLQPADSPAAAAVALQELPARGVEVFFLPPDQFAHTYAPALLALGQEQRLVVVNGNPRLNPRGAVLSVTLDYDALGEAAGHLVLRLLAGEKPKAIPIQQFSPALVEVDEILLSRWAGYPPPR